MTAATMTKPRAAHALRVLLGVADGPDLDDAAVDDALRLAIEALEAIPTAEKARPARKAATAKAPKMSARTAAFLKLSFAEGVARDRYIEAPGYLDRLKALPAEARAQFAYGTRGGGFREAFESSSVAKDKAILTGLHYAAGNVSAVKA